MYSSPFPLTAPVTPPLLCPVGTRSPRHADPAGSSRPPALSPDHLGCPRMPDLLGIASTCTPNAPVATPSPRPPLGLQDPFFLQRPPGHCISCDAPATLAPGFPGPHLSPLEALPLGRLHPRADPAPTKHFGQGVGYLLHGTGHPVHVAARSGVTDAPPPRDPLGTARPALPAGIRR